MTFGAMFILANAVVSFSPTSTYTSSVELGSARTASAELLPDGQTILWVFSPADDAILPQLRSQEPPFSGAWGYDIGKVVSEVYIRFLRPLDGIKSTAKGKYAKLRVSSENEAEVLRGRIGRALPRTVPSSYLAPRLSEAEAFLVSGDLLNAQRQFELLLGDEALKPWVSLRLADLTLLRGSALVACQNYAQIYEEIPGRSTGLLAWLRTLTLGCSKDEGATDNWAKVIDKISKLSSQVGQFLWQELVWTLTRVQRPEEIEFVLDTFTGGNLKTSFWRPNVENTMLSNLAARTLFFQSDPIHKLLVLSKYRNIFENSKDFPWIGVEATRVLQSLDHWEEVIVWGNKALAARAPKTRTWRMRGGGQQLRLRTAEAYRLSGQPKGFRRLQKKLKASWRKQKVPKQAGEINPLLDSVKSVRARLDLLEKTQSFLSQPSLGEGK